MFLLQKNMQSVNSFNQIMQKDESEKFGSCACLQLAFVTPVAAPNVQLGSLPSTEHNSEPKLGSEYALIEMLWES